MSSELVLTYLFEFLVVFYCGYFIQMSVRDVEHSIPSSIGACNIIQAQKQHGTLIIQHMQMVESSNPFQTAINKKKKLTCVLHAIHENYKDKLQFQNTRFGVLYAFANLALNARSTYMCD